MIFLIFARLLFSSGVVLSQSSTATDFTSDSLKVPHFGTIQIFKVAAVHFLR